MPSIILNDDSSKLHSVVNNEQNKTLVKQYSFFYASEPKSVVKKTIKRVTKTRTKIKLNLRLNNGKSGR